MPRPVAIHAPSPQPFPVPTPGPLGDTLTALGLRLDYRTACHPWGALWSEGDKRAYRVITDGDWNRVTCKGCLH